MPVFNSSRSVGYAPEDMFALVADVEHYPEFLPLCEALKVRRRSSLDENREMLIADMTIGYKAIRETFTSRVTLDAATNKILVEYVDGPFSHMQNRWSFVPENSGTRVEFYIDYQFKAYETIAYTKGVLLVSATPLTRSSHHAGEDFARLRAAREKQLGR